MGLVTHEGGGFPYELHVAITDRGCVEVHRSQTSARGELPREGRICEDPLDGRREARRVVGAREQAGLAVADDLARSVLTVGGDDRRTARHGLHQDGSEAFPAGGQDERRRARDPGPRIWHEPGHQEPRTDTQLACQRFETAALRTLTEDGQDQIRVRQASEGMQQQIEPFLPMQTTARDDEAGREVGAVRFLRESADPTDLHRVVNDLNAVSPHAKITLEPFGHPVRDGQHTVWRAVDDPCRQPPKRTAQTPRCVALEDRPGVVALAQDPGDTPPAVRPRRHERGEVHRRRAAHDHVWTDLTDQVELLERHERDARQESTGAGLRPVGHPCRRQTGEHDARRVDVAIELPAAREQTDPRVKPARLQVGDEREHRALRAAAVERRQEKEHARRLARRGRCHPRSSALLITPIAHPSCSYSDSNLRAAPSHVKPSRTRWRPRAASCAARSGCRESCSMASRSVPTSPASHSTPWWPCSTSSAVPPTRVAISGVPTAMADRTARLKLSSRDGRIAIEDSVNSFPSSWWSAHPRSSTFSVRPNSSRMRATVPW